jgi:hypothetical protein
MIRPNARAVHQAAPNQERDAMMLDKTRAALLFVLVVAIVTPALVAIRLMLDPLPAPPAPNKTPAPVETEQTTEGDEYTTPVSNRVGDESLDNGGTWLVEVRSKSSEAAETDEYDALMRTIRHQILPSERDLNVPAKLFDRVVIDAPIEGYDKVLDESPRSGDDGIGWKYETLIVPKDSP